MKRVNSAPRTARRGRRISGLLITAGCLIVAYAAFSWYYTGYRQEQLLKQYAAASRLAGRVEIVEEPLGQELPGRAEDEATPAGPPEEEAPSGNSSDDIELIGVLSIAKIDLTVAIGEGIDSRTLKYAVGHFPETALPGATGNCCIAGHRNYTWGQFFNRLDEVAAGDELVVERDGQTYTYLVTDAFVVEPEETWVLKQTEESQLTLITCTPIRIATERLIIRATLAP